ncbi:TetR/AcrR family transcriptional regulator [Microbacterium sp.]|uniref:TetR/AcrR family transcriptional regulator n=1 Tax=Microbacterium sp. TaxID=51671 RepID=UPI0027355024|nr:TetR/AcrR family transcriptional regulator [Microbacterium sp.]MDP3951258.1 TetR/AcrR family transcriptional regulator [Microbacterium sp.]
MRRSIIEACSAAFRESGFQGASMAEIARRAGISHTGLLYHFARKEELLTAVLALQDERGQKFLKEHALPQAGDGDAVPILRGMVTTLVERHRFAGLLELSAMLGGEATHPDHPAHEYFAQRYRDVRSFLTRIFAELRKQGRLTTPLTPEHLAATTLAITDGLNSQWLYERDDLDVEAVLQDFLRSVVSDFDGQVPR